MRPRLLSDEQRKERAKQAQRRCNNEHLKVLKKGIKPFLTADEVAAEYGVPAIFLRHWREGERVNRTRMKRMKRVPRRSPPFVTDENGNGVRYRRVDVEKWLKTYQPSHSSTQKWATDHVMAAARKVIEGFPMDREFTVRDVVNAVQEQNIRLPFTLYFPLRNRVRKMLALGEIVALRVGCLSGNVYRRVDKQTALDV